jgi:putative heme-binding domain-containing protein
VLKSPQGFEWAAQLEPSAKAAEIIADVAIAVPGPAAAEFLVAHLQRTNFSNGRAGDQLKHVAMQAAPERLPQIVELLEKATDAHAARLAFADGLFDATRKRGLKLPEVTSGWVQSTLLEALGSKDEGTIKRALQAVRDAKTERKLEPLSAIVRDAQRAEPLRIAALEALGNLPSATSVLVSALADPATALRKRAADLLGQQMTTATAEKMIAALATAPRELATAIASALAKSDAGAEPLLAAIESGRASAALLRNQSVSGAFAGRPQAMKDRAATLTTDLPPEDERLDKVIAQRLEAYAKAQPNRGHGAELFQQQCAACHKVKNVGGSIGPNLDGVSARGVHRLIEDILDPNRNVDPAFRQTIIETTDGRTLSGVNLRAQGELLVLNDVEGKEISVARNQVKTQTGSKLSLMPAIFEQALTEQQLADVISYLISETDAPAQAPQ